MEHVSPQRASIKRVKSWEASSGKKIISYTTHNKVVLDLAWSPDGKFIASTGYDNTVHVWDVDTVKDEFVYGGHFVPVVTVAWSSDGIHLASGDRAGSLHIWDITTGYRVFYYNEDHSYNGVSDISWHTDGQKVAWAISNGLIRTSHRGQAYGIHNYPGRTSNSDPTINAVIWMPSKWIVWGGNYLLGGNVAYQSFPMFKSLGQHNYQNQSPIFYTGHQSAVTTLAYSPINERIASGSEDCTVQVWDIPDGKNVFTYRGHSNKVTSLTWSPDGKYIASADEGGTILVWQAM